MPKRRTCECSDPGCPVHKASSYCPHHGRTTVRRIDMDDGTTTFLMCRGCSDDAIASGVFA